MSVFIQRPVHYLHSVDRVLADKLSEPFVEPELQADELDEDTQPSMLLPDADDDFCDAPTIPRFTLRADGAVVRDAARAGRVAEGQWDRALRAVAVAVKRVFASHSIRSAS
jgi:hypothetical protein